jgi:hypothetical protein
MEPTARTPLTTTPLTVALVNDYDIVVWASAR